MYSPHFLVRRAMYIVSIAVKSIFHCIHFNMIKKEEEQIPATYITSISNTLRLC